MGSISANQNLVYVDANCVIYAVERVTPFAGQLEPLWRAARAGRLRIVTSQLTLMEVLVRPLREQNRQLASLLRAFLLHSSECELITFNASTFERAAQLRAEFGVRTPDALHAATALESAVVAFVTNDASFRRVPNLSVFAPSALPNHFLA